MTSVGIVFSSNNGHTRTVAEHIGHGVNNFPEARADLIEIKPDQLQANGMWRDDAIMARLEASDAIIFGSPTFMGSAHSLFKAFLEAGFSPWVDQLWKDKIAAGFSNSSARSGDKLVAIQQMSTFAAQMGMIWVGVGDPPGGNYSGASDNDVNLSGSWQGLMTQSISDGPAEGSPHPGDRLSAERFGRRVARSTVRWMMGATTFPSEHVSMKESFRRNVAGPDEWRRYDD